jgi:hypothetical protein
MNRRTLIRTVTLGAAGAAFSGPLSAATKTTGLVEAPNLAAQLAATEEAWWGSMSQALRLALADNPALVTLFPVAEASVDLCARQLDVSERSFAQTGVCSSDNLTVIFDRTNLMSTQMQIYVRAVVPVDDLKVRVTIAP